MTTSGTYYDTLTSIQGCEGIIETTLTITALPTVTFSGNTSVCLGESTTVTASRGTGYTWDTGDSTTSITVNPNTTSVYSITVSNR